MRRHLLRLIGRGPGAPRVDAPGASSGFDPDFYRALHPDLAGLDAAAAARHFADHGLAEGRHGDLLSLLRGSGAPEGFDPGAYRRANADLASLDTLALVQHYAAHGAREGRRYIDFNAELYREAYDRPDLSDAEAWAHFRERDDGVRIGSGRRLAAARGWPGGAWIDLIRPSEFRLLNWDWAGEVTGIESAARAVLAGGMDRMAPLAFATTFDPAFYAELRPELGDAAPAALYRDWLFAGCDRDDPANAAELFRRLGFELHAYPEAFDWRAYLAARPGAGATRWSALRHLVSVDATSDPPCVGEGAGAFLAALAAAVRDAAPHRAVALLEAARDRAPLLPPAEALLAELRLRSGDAAGALGAFQAAAARGTPGLATVCDGARAAASLGRFDDAFDLLAAGRERWGATPWWRHALGETVEAEFAAERSEAALEVVSGNRAAGCARLEQAIRRTRGRWAEFDPIGAAVPSSGHGRVAVLADISLAQCRHYRVEQKAELLEALGRPHHVFPLDEVEDFISALPGCDVAIVYRAPALPKVVRALEYARRLGVPLIYEIDDLIFDPAHFPEPFETYGGEISREQHWGLQLDPPLFRAAMALCDRGIASTEDLARHMRPVVRSGVVDVVPNGLDSHNVAWLDAPPARVRLNDEILIFYGSGTKAHNSDFVELAGPALRTVLCETPQARLILAGHLQTEGLFAGLEAQVSRLAWTGDLQAYAAALAEADINLAVLRRTPSTDGKSEIKWLEAAVLGVPSIVSDTAAYREVLTPEVDVLFAADAQGWTDTLRRMVADAELRARLTRGARALARERYAPGPVAARLEATLPPRTSPPDRRRPRVLVVNVFFPPQTLGGATRVVRDNVDDMLAAGAGDLFDLAVCTNDHDEPEPYRLRVDGYRGLPVFRFSSPAEVNMDWRPFNPKCEELFERVLDIWRPDLVHFHCVQRLTASTVEACRARGTPYVVTLHDAWWIADHAFLIDEADRPIDPRRSIAARPTREVSTGASVLRRRELAPLLEGAARLFAVSETFARLYRACGFGRAEALPNGAPPLARRPKTLSAAGRVRLCHIGSPTHHKGFTLVEAALRRGAFANLELTVVEHTRVGGSVREVVWGATPVRFVGKTAQEEMPGFYAGQDVLLAPSVWPESFGLVSREALDAGLWVVASDRGAIGEPVTPGCDGWVIDVATPAALYAVLAEIDATPERYRAAPPPPTGPPRRSADQARELMAVYAELLGLEPRVLAAE